MIRNINATTSKVTINHVIIKKYIETMNSSVPETYDLS